MRLHQAAVTQHFGNKPTCLAAEGSLYHITDFGNHAIVLQLASRQGIIHGSLVLNAILNAA